MVVNPYTSKLRLHRSLLYRENKMDDEYIYQKILLAPKLACQNQDVKKRNEKKWAST